MFGFIASLSKLWLYVGVLAVLGALYWLITDAAYDRGVEDTTERYEAVIEAERERLTRANDRALEWARRRAGALASKVEKQDEKLADLMAKAARDPNADRVCIGPDSVRRLNLD